MDYGKKDAWEEDILAVALDGGLVQGIGSGYGMTIGLVGGAPHKNPHIYTVARNKVALI